MIWSPKSRRSAAASACVRARIGGVIFGQEDVVEHTLITFLSGGHVLLIGVPGLAKTQLVETLGVVLGMDDKRIQFTPDLMPADILGSEVLEESDTGRRSFRFIQGPVFGQLLMADEINRASPRTQSALLQACRSTTSRWPASTTAAGARSMCWRPRTRSSRKAPIPLPEAQLDRFLLQIDVGYPDATAERQIMIATTGVTEAKPRQALTPADLMAAQRWCAACRSAKAWSTRS